MEAYWLGRTPYEPAWALQRELADLRSKSVIGNVLLLLEHPPTITLGRATDAAHVLASHEELQSAGVEVVAIDRGGDVTYHGPGQLVGYPIVRLTDHRADLHWYLREVEAALIDVLAAFGVEGRRFPPHTGVWVGDRKAAAIGICVRRWVTTHGFALNVAPGIDGFGLIVPCGIRGYGVTSLSEAAGRSVAVGDVLGAVVRAFGERFDAASGPSLCLDSLSPDGRAVMAHARRA